MTTQLFVASTAFGLATIAAALEDGAWPDARRRVLVISNNTTTPETTPGPLGTAGIDRLTALFDQVHDYNELIAPLHPAEWRPPESELPLLHRLVAEHWGLAGEDRLRLVVESIQSAPALTLARLFPDAPIDVYADGLMSYGPTRVGLFTQVGSRIDRLLQLDLVPGVTPLLLREWDARPVIIGSSAFRRVIAGLDVEPPKTITAAPPGSVAVLLGQYLSAAGILSLEEEQELLVGLVSGAAAAGFATLLFKPHPSAPDLLTAPLIAEAERLGVELTVHDEPDLAECWFDAPGIGLVAGCFSTALLTAATCYGLPTARLGTELALERVRPYENSNRIPVTLAHATLPDLAHLAPGAAAPAPARVSPDELVRLVGYCMQAKRNPDLRPDAERLLTEHWDEVRGYVKRRRLTILDLPGRLPPKTPKTPKAPKTAAPKRTTRRRSRLRRTVRRILGPRLSRAIARTLRPA
ncbi:MAG TPA: polysialyltransferase family glycosyltransferase [Microlunatus sp.]|nr:polysialyltransferase family glycosyltransferase [Microlunatus sp.]